MSNSQDHNQAISDLYAKHNVGQDSESKLSFWNTNYPRNIYAEINPSQERLIQIHEFSYLVDQFPSDFERY